MTTARDATGAAGGRANLSDWLAVLAGTLGALMATLDVSIVNSALPVVQGEIGASGTEGTWIATAYLVAEIIIIPLSAWLTRLLGLRTLLLTVTFLFTIFSIVCGISTSLPMMIIGRLGQGMTGGALIPTAMTIIATRLPPAQQAIGNACFGATALVGPVVGPLLGGWLTEAISWHYIFFVNLPLSFVLIVLLLTTMAHEQHRLDLITQADWLGIAGLAFGLGGLTVVLEEGERERWFESSMIQQLALMSLIGFVLLFLGQIYAAKPVIRLRLLLQRQFSSVIIMSMVVSMVSYGTAYAIPQFLAGVANYNALQSGIIVMLSGVPILLMMPITPLMIRTLDIRLAVGIGMLLLAGSAFLETDLSPLSAGGAFGLSQVLRGIGTTFTGLFLNQAAIRSVTRQHAADAAGVYNAARNVGGSLALAAIAILQDRREWLHSRRIEETLNANSPLVQSWLDAQGGNLNGPSPALSMLENIIHIQALTMTYADLFWLLAITIIIVTPLVVILRPLQTVNATVKE